MAKIIKYKFLMNEINHGTEAEPNIEQIFFEKTLSWSEASEEIAKREAYKGAYIIEENGNTYYYPGSTEVTNES